MLRCTYFSLSVTGILLLLSGLAMLISSIVMLGSCWIYYVNWCQSENTIFWVLLFLGIMIVVFGTACLASAKRIRFGEVERENDLQRPPEVHYLFPPEIERREPTHILPPLPSYENFAYDYHPSETRAGNPSNSINPSSMFFGPPPEYDQIPKP